MGSRVLATKADCRKVAMTLANNTQPNAFFSTASNTDRDGNIETYEFEVWTTLSEASGVFKRNVRSGVVRDSQFNIDDQREFATVIVAWAITYPSDVPASVSSIIQGWRDKLAEEGSKQADDLAAYYGQFVWPVKAVGDTFAASKWSRENMVDYACDYHCGMFWFADQTTAATFKMFWG